MVAVAVLPTPAPAADYEANASASTAGIKLAKLATRLTAALPKNAAGVRRMTALLDLVEAGNDGALHRLLELLKADEFKNEPAAPEPVDPRADQTYKPWTIQEWRAIGEQLEAAGVLDAALHIVVGIYDPHRGVTDDDVDRVERVQCWLVACVEKIFACLPFESAYQTIWHIVIDDSIAGVNRSPKFWALPAPNERDGRPLTQRYDELRAALLEWVRLAIVSTPDALGGGFDDVAIEAWDEGKEHAPFATYRFEGERTMRDAIGEAVSALSATLDTDRNTALADLAHGFATARATMAIEASLSPVDLLGLIGWLARSLRVNRDESVDIEPFPPADRIKEWL